MSREKRLKIVDLGTRIKQCSREKAKLESYLQNLKEDLLNNELDRVHYDDLVSTKVNGKTIPEWLSYYDDYIERCQERIDLLKDESKKSSIKRVGFSLGGLFLIFALILGTLLYLTAEQPEPLLAPSVEYVQEVGETYTFRRNTYVWKLENIGSLESLKSSGSIEGNGEVRIYINDLLILDSETLPIGDVTENIDSILLAPSGNESNGTIPPPPENESENNETNVTIEPPSGNETDNNKTNGTIIIPPPENETEQNDTNVTEPPPPEEPPIKKFSNYCDQTCDLSGLEGFDQESYVLRIEVEGEETILNFDSLTYAISEIEEEGDKVEISEIEISRGRKEVSVLALDDVQNIIIETSIEEIEGVKKESISILDENDNPIDFETKDSDGNGLIDAISFDIASMDINDIKNFEVKIRVLNVQSYPEVGGFWVVEFETVGQADLIIRAIEQTTWSNVDEDEDLKFIEVRCGDQLIEYEWLNDEVVITDFECDSIGTEKSLVITPGVHNLEFEFGGIKAYANNDASYGPFTFDTDNDPDESEWTFVADFGITGLNPPGTFDSWSHDTDDTSSSNVGPTSGQEGDPDGYVYTEASGGSSGGQYGDTFHMTFNTILDASTDSWEIEFYWNQRGNDNTATVQVQTNENGAGWITRATFGDGTYGGPPDVISGGVQIWRQETVDLAGLISDASTQIRFLVTFPSSGTIWHNDFGLDSITITGSTLNNPPSDPTSLGCNGDFSVTGCDIVVDASVDVEASGSIDPEADPITYFIEASLDSPTTGTDQEPGIQEVKAGLGVSGNDPNRASTFGALTTTGILNNNGYTIARTNTQNCAQGTCSNANSWRAGFDNANPANTQVDWDFDISSLGILGSDITSLTLNGGGCWAGGPNAYDCDGADDAEFAAGTSPQLQMQIYNWNTMLFENFGAGYEITPGGNGGPGPGANYRTYSRSKISGFSDNHVSGTGTIRVRYNIAGVTMGSSFDVIGIYDFAQLTLDYNLPEIDNEGNSDWVEYTSVEPSPLNDISNIDIKIQTTYYDPRGSLFSTNIRPDLEVGFWNGLSYTNGHYCDLISFYGDSESFVTYECIVTTFDPVIRTTWENPSLRDIQIRGSFLDVELGFEDTIRWDSVIAEIDSKVWTEIGSHLPGTPLTWNSAPLPQQTEVNLRARAIDLPPGSNIYSNYFTKNPAPPFLEIDHGINNPPTIDPATIIVSPDPVVLLAGTTTDVTVMFTAEDADGPGDLVESSATVSFIKSDETTRVSGPCVGGPPVINEITYTCTVTMQYFDGPGTWDATASIEDVAMESATETNTFDVSLLQDITLTGTPIDFGVVSPSTQIDAPDFIVTNNGNYEGTIKMTANDLTGPETLDADNFRAMESSIPLNVCNFGVILQHATLVEITTTNLQKDTFPGEGMSQDITVCLNVPPVIQPGDYSAAGPNAWEISLTLAVFARRKKKRKKKEIKDDNLLKAVSLMTDELKEKYNMSQSDLIKALGLEKKNDIPVNIFSKKLGGLEAICKFMKENLGMSYHEIAIEINRNDRTVWTAVKKAKEKSKEKIKIEKDSLMIPLEIFKDGRLTVLEAVIVHLREKGMKHAEIGKLLERDQRNVQTIYSRAKKKEMG